MCVCVCVCVHTVFCTACVSVEKTPLPGAAALSEDSSQAETSGSPFSPPPSLLPSTSSCSSSSSSASSPTDVLWRRRASPAFVFTDVRLCPEHSHMCDNERSVKRHKESSKTQGCWTISKGNIPMVEVALLRRDFPHELQPAQPLSWCGGIYTHTPPHTHTSDDSRSPKEVGCWSCYKHQSWTSELWENWPNRNSSAALWPDKSTQINACWNRLSTASQQDPVLLLRKL